MAVRLSTSLVCCCDIRGLVTCRDSVYIFQWDIEGIAGVLDFEKMVLFKTYTQIKQI